METRERFTQLANNLSIDRSGDRLNSRLKYILSFIKCMRSDVLGYGAFLYCWC